MKKLILIVLVFVGIVFNTQAQTKYKIGDKAFQGIVFYVSADSLHGLVAQSEDYKVIGQKSHIMSCTIVLQDKKLSGYRMPNKEELQKLYMQRVIVGGFSKSRIQWYWYMQGQEMGTRKAINFSDGNDVSNISPTNEGNVRLVKSF